MKKPPFDNVFIIVVLLIGVSAGFYNWLHAKPELEPERYIDYCGQSVYKLPGAVLPEGITPLLLPDRDVPKYQRQASLVRPATAEELQILLRRYGVRTLRSGYQLWTVEADAPSIVHTLARQYQCTIEELMDAEDAAREPS